MELCHNGFQAQLRQFKGCGFGEVDVVFPEAVPVNYRIMACASWVVKKGSSDIQQDYVLVADLVGALEAWT